MIDTFALGEQVRKDPKLTIKKKEEVKVHLNSLTARWDRVKDFLSLRNERYAKADSGLVIFICSFYQQNQTSALVIYLIVKRLFPRVLICAILQIKRNQKPGVLFYKNLKTFSPSFVWNSEN